MQGLLRVWIFNELTLGRRTSDNLSAFIKIVKGISCMRCQYLDTVLQLQCTSFSLQTTSSFVGEN